jgi:hypothetical protein
LAAYAARRLLAVVVVVLVTPSLTYVLLGSLRDGVAVTDKASELPRYRSTTFLHLDSATPRSSTSPGARSFDTMPVDVARWSVRSSSGSP